MNRMTTRRWKRAVAVACLTGAALTVVAAPAEAAGPSIKVGNYPTLSKCQQMGSYAVHYGADKYVAYNCFPTPSSGYELWLTLR
jgi:hypothetical protein